MKWRIAANGLALVVILSGIGLASSTSSASQVESHSRQRTQDLDARSALAKIKITNEHPAGYKRSLFIHWSDEDGDGCDTREEVLQRDSTTVAQVDPYKCWVVAGDWISEYDGAHWDNRSQIDIDHVVALKEAWDSGAWNWSESLRKAFANDLTDSRTLKAVTDRVNKSKGEKDPSNWMPPLRKYWCSYLGDWIAIKARWGLTMDQSEHGRIKNLVQGECSGMTIATWGMTPITVPDLIEVKAPTTSTLPTTTHSTNPVTTSSVTTVTTTTQLTVKEIHPGAYCSPVDALSTYRGLAYICSKTSADGVPYSGNRARWRKLGA